PAGMTRVPPGAAGDRGVTPVGPGEVWAGSTGTDTGEPAGPIDVEVPASDVAARRATWPNAEAVGNRAAGSLAIAFSTIPRTAGGMSVGSGAGCSRTCFIAISSGLSPSNGRRPDRHWYATTPSA